MVFVGGHSTGGCTRQLGWMQVQFCSPCLKASRNSKS